MKKSKAKTVFLIGIIITFSIAGCTKEKEKANSKFVGTYIGNANCDGSITNESIPIEASSNDASGIKMFLNSAHTLNASVNGNSISIPVQNFPSGNENYRYSGLGTLNGNALSLTISVLYSSVDPDYPYTCVFTLSK